MRIVRICSFSYCWAFSFCAFFFRRYLSNRYMLCREIAMVFFYCTVRHFMSISCNGVYIFPLPACRHTGKSMYVPFQFVRICVFLAVRREFRLSFSVCVNILFSSGVSRIICINLCIFWIVNHHTPREYRLKQSERDIEQSKVL